MTLVERPLTGRAPGEPDSAESRAQTRSSNIPASAPRETLAAPERPTPDSAPGDRAAWLHSAWGKLALRGLGIAALMLGLGGIGALATAQGQSLGRGPALPTASAHGGWLATQAGMAGPAPTATPTASAPGVVEPPSSAKASAGLTADGKVILNTAGVAELRKLPGLGPKRAEAVLTLRERLGKFRRLSDLLRVKGIGPKRLKQWQGKLVLDAEQPTTPSGSAKPTESAVPAASTPPAPSAAAAPQPGAAMAARSRSTSG